MRRRMSASISEFLLIDNSNSFTKFALASREKIGRSRKLRTSEVTDASLKKTLRGWRWKTAVLSSVVPDKGEIMAGFLGAGGARVVRVSAKVRLGVGVKYPKPRTIGADRLANAAAAFAAFGGPVVVVDFGTAVSFDIVSGD